MFKNNLGKELSLRDYQKNIKQRVFDAWRNHASVMVQMPTGTGKTHLLASIIYDLLSAEQDLCVWIIAHRRELVEQIEDTVARYGIRKEDGRIRAMSIQWLSRHWDDIHNTPALIVIDEAHHALAESYKELWTRYPHAKKLGMTATPCRLNRRGFTDLFDTLVMSDSIADFISKGWLSVFDYASIKPDSDDQKLIDNLSKRSWNGDFQIKEMDTVLNKRPTIEKLYESVRHYADGKKGVVYAISIGHARNIASYYSGHGINAVAIDSKTPALQRKQFVEDFKQGRIQVLVNVDVFSEGFDCPDIEFVQMARPTLSLAKYLQQVGRGLRKSKGKEYCMLIDNVGLYRMFGLPSANRNWQTMFEGRLAGKGNAHSIKTGYYCAAENLTANDTIRPNDTLELVMTHDRLPDYLTNAKDSLESHLNHKILNAFKDRVYGLYGLKIENKITASPQYVSVFDTDDGFAAVRFKNWSVGVVNEVGEIKIQLECFRKLKFLKDKLLAATDNRGKMSYIDLRSGKSYKQKPKVLTFGKVQMLEVDGICYSRTKILYKKELNTSLQQVCQHGFCLRFYDFLTTPQCRQVDKEDDTSGYDSVCLLADDYETYYHFCGMLPDGSIIVEDNEGKYYLVKEGEGKQYIAHEKPQTEEETFEVVIPRLKAEAAQRAAQRKSIEKREKIQKRKERLNRIQHAKPFKSGLKWGLKQGDKVIVPPIYRNLQTPVGNYCAFEGNPRLWGIIMLDGKVVVEARYINVEIKENGTARLTIIPGKTKTVKLHGND
ncbi:DEAD/DEAH box helicase [Paraprevotella xylaniphila]|mgnify:FL=1|jgi:superfamily II DNA or RNA helicase